MSQQTSHAPGPWKMGPIDYAGVYDADGDPVALICKDWETAVENARLIAAAPELLSGAKLLIESAEAEGWDRVRGTDEPRSGIAELRAAIAKAEGRS